MFNKSRNDKSFLTWFSIFSNRNLFSLPKFNKSLLYNTNIWHQNELFTTLLDFDLSYIYIYFDYHLPPQPSIAKRRKQSCTPNIYIYIYRILDKPPKYRHRKEELININTLKWFFFRDSDISKYKNQFVLINHSNIQSFWFQCD